MRDFRLQFSRRGWGRFLVTMSLAILCGSGLAHDSEPPIDIKVTAAATKMPTGAWRLKFSLFNNSGQPVRIYEASLPWGVRTSLTLMLVPTGIDQSPLPASYFIDDPGPKIATIAAHSEMSGDVDLSNRFPDLGKVTSKRDVIAFWSYEPRTVDGVRGAREFGGALLTSPSKDDSP